MRVTRADVAQRAGVSPSVVSYVLNPGTRPVAPVTRDRVMQAIKELGYRPNAIARALREGPTRSIGLLLPDLTNPFFAEVSRAVEAAAFASNRVVFVGATQDDDAREAAYVHSFVDRRVDALIMVSPTGLTLLEEVAASGVPVVTLDRVPLDDSGVSCVYVDNTAGVADAVGYLAGLGHERIGFIAGPENLQISRDREQGWRRGLELAGLSPRASDIAYGPFTRDGGVKAGQRILDNTKLTAIITSSDVQAIGLLTQTRLRGISVPSDLSLIAFDGTELASFADPPLTVVQQPVEELAKAALETADQLVGGETEPVRIVLPASLYVRNSTSVPAR